ncbi:MAG: hypothetical protein RIQ81_892 [Pseudomonadota bacterium]
MAIIFRVLITVLGAMPACVAECLASGIGWLSTRLPSKRLRLMKRNVDQVLGLAPHTSFAQTFYAQVFSSQIRCLIDTCRGVIWPGSVQIEDGNDWVDLVRRLESDGRGIIFMAAHIGSWELAANKIAATCSRHVRVLAKRPKVPGGAAALEWLRGKSGVSVLWSHKKSLVKDMMSALRKGEHLGMVVDQKPEGRVGDTVQFFNRPVAFVTGPASMSLRCDAVIVSVAVVRTGMRRFRLMGRLVFDPRSARDLSGEQEAVHVSQLCTDEIEQWIRLYPEQWTWEYKRWIFNT